MPSRYRKIISWVIQCLVFFIALILYMLIVIPYARLERSVRLWKKRKPRIIWGPFPILTLLTNSAADRLYGYKSDTLVYSTYYITDKFTYNLERFFKSSVLSLFLRCGVFFWASINYDIFQFYFHGGFLSKTIAARLELPLLRFAGKRIIVSAYGADVRVESITRSLGEYNCCMDCRNRLKSCICSEQLANRNIDHTNRYANITLSMGDMIEYTPDSRNDMFYWSIDLNEWEYVGTRTETDVVIIVHAPNHPQFKGTHFLCDVVIELKEEGYPVELVLVQGMSNEEAKDAYRKADIIAEQFIIGWHGYFAIEAMALGKPVVCYIRTPAKYLPKGVECPIVNANPDNLKDTLIKLIEDPILRRALGLQGRKYVEEIYSLEKVGQRMDKLYQEIWYVG